MRVSRVLRVLRVLRALRALRAPCVMVSVVYICFFQSSVGFGLS